MITIGTLALAPDGQFTFLAGFVFFIFGLIFSLIFSSLIIIVGIVIVEIYNSTEKIINRTMREIKKKNKSNKYEVNENHNFIKNNSYISFLLIYFSSLLKVFTILTALGAGITYISEEEVKLFIKFAFERYYVSDLYPIFYYFFIFSLILLYSLVFISSFNPTLIYRELGIIYTEINTGNNFLMGRNIISINSSSFILQLFLISFSNIAIFFKFPLILSYLREIIILISITSIFISILLLAIFINWIYYKKNKKKIINKFNNEFN